MRIARELNLKWQPVREVAEGGWCLPSMRSRAVFPRLRPAKRLPSTEVPEDFDSALDLFGNLGGQRSIRVRGPLLGEFFFGACRDDPSQYFPLAPVVARNDSPLIAVHLRGTDFAEWNPNAILPVSYYLDALEVAREMAGSAARIELVTDDPTMDSVVTLQSELALDGRPRQRSVEDDFALLRGADVIVSSPSTFCIWAGILSQARVIHSNVWVRQRADMGDRFWLDLMAGGNQFYHAEVLV